MEPEKARKIIIGAAILLGVFLVGVLIYKFFTTGYVEITTNDPNAKLTITQRPPYARTVDADFKDKRARLSLDTGVYVVKATGVNGSSQAVIKVKFARTEKVNLDIKKAADDLHIEPVSSFGAMFLSGNATHLTFLNQNYPLHNHVLTINDQNRIVDRSAGYGGEGEFMLADWKNPLEGVGLSYGVYLINNQNIASLNPTPSPNPGKTSVASGGEKLFVSDSKHIYVGRQGENFKQIYTTNDKSTINIISASGDYVVAVEKTSISRAGKVVVVNAKDNSAKSISGEIYEGFFSPNGEKILLNGDINGIYDRNLKLVNDVPINNSISPKWLSDNEIVFADAKGVWNYNLDTGKSIQLANLSDIPGYLHYIEPDVTSRYIYIDSQRDFHGQRSFKLFRIRNGEQKANSAFMNKLDLLFPYSSNDCYYDYINFSQTAKPTIVTSGITSIQQSCKKIIKDYLSTYDIDLSQLQFQNMNLTKAKVD